MAGRNWMVLGAVALVAAFVLTAGCSKKKTSERHAQREEGAPQAEATAPEEAAGKPQAEAEAPEEKERLPEGVAPQGTEPSEETGVVSVASFPPGGRVLVNGDTLGVLTPTTLILDPGDYVVKVRAKGFASDPDSVMVRVTAGGRDSVFFELEGEPMAKIPLLTNEAKEVWPRWSPDGKTIVFEGYYGHNRDIYTIPVTGGSPKRLTFHRKADFAPSWSPDGRKIVFSSNRSGTVELWVIDANGGEPKQLTHGGGAEQNAVYSPDGKWIAFESLSKIWKIPAEGGEPIQVTKGKERHFYPAWSPDGREIAFTVQISGQTRQIWAVDVKTGKMRKIVADKGWSYAPAWSPNGKVLAFVRRGPAPDLNHDLWLVSREGGPLTQITLDAGYDQYPSWSPDGKQIVYAKNADIWVMTNLPDWARGEGEFGGS